MVSREFRQCEGSFTNLKIPALLAFKTLLHFKHFRFAVITASTFSNLKMAMIFAFFHLSKVTHLCKELESMALLGHFFGPPQYLYCHVRLYRSL